VGWSRRVDGRGNFPIHLLAFRMEPTIEKERERPEEGRAEGPTDGGPAPGLPLGDVLSLVPALPQYTF
jgi:hypothetical protein